MRTPVSTDEGSEEPPDWKQRAREATQNPEICSRCHGKGYVTLARTLHLAKHVECSMCNGTGRIDTDDGESDG